jgi:hypothetical protein
MISSGTGRLQLGSDFDGEATTTPALAPEALEPLAPMLARTPCRATVFSDESQEAREPVARSWMFSGEGRAKAAPRRTGRAERKRMMKMMVLSMICLSRQKVDLYRFTQRCLLEVMISMSA